MNIAPPLLPIASRTTVSLLIVVIPDALPDEFLDLEPLVSQVPAIAIITLVELDRRLNVTAPLLLVTARTAVEFRSPIVQLGCCPFFARIDVVAVQACVAAPSEMNVASLFITKAGWTKICFFFLFRRECLRGIAFISQVDHVEADPTPMLHDLNHEWATEYAEMDGDVGLGMGFCVFDEVLADV